MIKAVVMALGLVHSRPEAKRTERVLVNWIKRHPLTSYTAFALAVTFVFAWVMSDLHYRAEVAKIPADTDPEMRWRLEFHASENASAWFLASFIAASPWLIGALLIGFLVIVAIRQKA